MTFLDLAFIFLVGQEISQVRCHAVVPSRPFGTSTTFTPEYEIFGAQSDFSQTTKDVQTVLETIERIKTASSDEFTFTDAVILSFKQRAINSKDQLYRVLGESNHRARREADSGANIVSFAQNTFGRFGNFIGLASKRDIDDLEKQLAVLSVNLESADENISTTLSSIKQSFNETVKNFHKFVEKSLRKVQKGHDERWSLDVQLKSLLKDLDKMVVLLLEIRDRADHNFPSRLVLGSDKVQDWIDRTSKKYQGQLYPIYDDPDSYFKLPMTNTTIINRKVILKFVMPLQEQQELFFKKTETKTLSTLESNKRRIQVTHRQLDNCHESVNGMVCIMRSCRLNKFSEAVRACLITTTNTGEDLVEVIYNLPYLKTQPAGQEEIILNCQGGLRKVFKVKAEIVQFTIPEFCEAKNSHLDIPRVYTTKHTVLSPQFSYRSFNLTEASKKKFKSDGINEEVRHLVAQKKRQTKLKDIGMEGDILLMEHKEKLGAHKSIAHTLLGAIVPCLLIFIIVLGFMIFKKQQQRKSAIESLSKTSEMDHELADVSTDNGTEIKEDTPANLAEQVVAEQTPGYKEENVPVQDPPPQYDFDTHRNLYPRIRGLN